MKEVVLVQCNSGHRNWIEPEAQPMVQAYYCSICGKPILTPLNEEDAGLSEAEKKEQAARCACRGSDDYCPCQNVPDAKTLADRGSRLEREEWSADTTKWFGNIHEMSRGEVA